jgi:hypothetical protein
MSPDFDQKLDQEFEKRVGDLLRASSDSLDGRTRSRLTQARYAALEQARASKFSGFAAWRNWAPVGAVAMAVLVTVFYVGQRGAVNVSQPTPASAAGSGLDDLELLADADVYALSTEDDAELDADFYEWAAASAANGSST